MDEQAKKSFIINVIFIAIVGLIIILSGKILLTYLFPFVLAVTVAVLIQKPANAAAKALRLKKGTCAAVLSAFIYISVAFVMLLSVLRAFSFTGELTDSVSGIGESLTSVSHKLEIVSNRIFLNISPELKSAVDKVFYGAVDSIISKISSFLSGIAATLVKSAPAFLFNSVVALAATCYIAKDFDGLIKFLKTLIPYKGIKTVRKVKNILKENVLKILVGYLILSVITFIELALGLALLGVKNWILISALIALFDALPVLGAGAFLIPWGALNIILGNKGLGAGLLILYLVLVVVRNFAEPKIVGSKTGINPLFILFTMFLGLKLFGVLGLILLPVTFIVVIKYYKSEMEQELS